MKVNMPVKFKTSLMKAKLKVGKHGPEILLVTGIVGVITSAVMACAATVKAKDVVEEAKEELADLKNENEVSLIPKAPEEIRKEIVTVYVRAGKDLAKLYLPSLILGGLSITSIVGSNGILKKRNAELTAAYSALALAYGEYRKRMRAALGDDADEELCYDLKKKEFEVETVDENGDKTVTKTTLDVVEDDICSPYAVFFDRRTSQLAEESVKGNKMVLEQIEKWANIVLSARASEDEPLPLFWNEILDRMQVKRKPIGQLAGWRIDPDNKDIDNAVIFRTRIVKRPDGFGNYYDSILVDPNVDGDVLSVWDEKRRKLESA